MNLTTTSSSSRDAEQELVQLAIDGDRLALERLLLLHASRLCRHLEPRMPGMLQGIVDVDDILQQTFLQVYRDIRLFEPRGQGSFYAWLRGIADNRMFDCVREYKRKKRGGDFKRCHAAPSGSAHVNDVLDAFCTSHGTPSKVVARREAVEAMQLGLADLPSDQHEAIERHCIQGESLEQTANAMGKTPGAIRALIHRGKGKLQEWLDRSAIWLAGDREHGAFLRCPPGNDQELDLLLRKSERWFRRVAVVGRCAEYFRACQTSPCHRHWLTSFSLSATTS